MSLEIFFKSGDWVIGHSYMHQQHHFSHVLFFNSFFLFAIIYGQSWPQLLLEYWNCIANINAMNTDKLPRDNLLYLTTPSKTGCGHPLASQSWLWGDVSGCHLLVSMFAQKTSWTEEPGGLQSMGSPRVRHDWATSLSLFTFMHWRRKWQPTPVFLPAESQGRGSLVGCHLWSRIESDTTEVT